MTDYQRRSFTYRPLPVRNHPELSEPPYNLMVGMFDPDAVAVLTVELDRIETILPSMAEFEAQDEVISE